MSKKAKYKKLLTDTQHLLTTAHLKTSLYHEATIRESSTDDYWTPDFESIWALLHHNYNNPKAMNSFIFYDISDNKLRTQLAKYLLKKGAQRIQKSVYLANIDKLTYQTIFETLSELQESFGEYDSVFMVPIGEYHLAEMNMVGKDVDLSFARSNEYVIFI